MTPTPTDPREEQPWIPKVGDWVIAKASYCGENDRGCTDATPCPECLEMCNRFVIAGEHYGLLFFHPQLCNRDGGCRLDETCCSMIATTPDAVPVFLKKSEGTPSTLSDFMPIPHPLESTNSKLAAEIAELKAQLATEQEERERALVTVDTLTKRHRSTIDSRNAYMINAGKAELTRIKAEKEWNPLMQYLMSLPEFHNSSREGNNVQRVQTFIATLRAELEAVKADLETAQTLADNYWRELEAARKERDEVRESHRREIGRLIEQRDGYMDVARRESLAAVDALAAKDASEKENKELREREGQLVIKWEGQQDRANQLESKLATLCAAKEKRVAEALPIISDALSELSLTLANTERRESADCRLAAYLKASRASELIAALTPPTQEPSAGGVTFSTAE